MATLKDVARLAGVSASTVSRTLSGNIHVDEQTQQKVWAAIKELKYKPNILAKSLKEGRTNTVALIIPNIRNPIFPAVTRGAEDTARKNGFTLILCNTDEDISVEKDYIDKLTNRWVDGFIFATARDDSSHITELKAQGIPVVFMIRSIDNHPDTVTVDNRGGAYKAVDYLISRGCTKIAFINGPLDIDLYRQRLDGYKNALKEHGIPIDDRLIVNEVNDQDNGYHAMLSLLDKGIKMDAVFAASDPKAVNAIKAIKSRGLSVPGDISVIGFDDLDIATIIEPSLTTIAQPAYDIGTTAMDTLIRLIDGHKNAMPIVLDTRLVVRRSVR
jgi:DNA-binding LacI/PurR family transcriptional regulator